MSVKKTILILFLLSFTACMKQPSLLDPSNSAFNGAGWYVIDEANDAVTGISLSTFAAYANVMPDANSAVMADIAFLPGLRRAFLAGGYASWASEGSHDIKAFDMDTGLVVYRHDFGAGWNIPPGGLMAVDSKIHSVFYSDSGEGRYRRFNTSLGQEADILLGGMPQGLTVRDGNVFVANMDSYAYATNWIDILPAGTGPALRLEVSEKNPVSLCLSADGQTLYLLCAGDWGAYFGAVVVVTNAPLISRGVQSVIPLSDYVWGKMKEVNGRIFYTAGDGLYELDTILLSVSVVALAGESLNDIDSDGVYLYVTSAYGGTNAWILDASTLATVRTLNVSGGMGALLQ